MTLTLHPQLQQDCFFMGQINSSILLLHKNALVPWFIIVPDTAENELYKLDEAHQRAVNEEINSIGRFVTQHFATDKLNIATIGNIVPQLHVHIIGRQVSDFCWPNPVWGQSGFSQYKASDVDSLQQALLESGLVKNITLTSSEDIPV